ncbi:MAG: hypothetical protein ACOX2F_11260 [bacterium]
MTKRTLKIIVSAVVAIFIFSCSNEVTTLNSEDGIDKDSSETADKDSKDSQNEIDVKLHVK